MAYKDFAEAMTAMVNKEGKDALLTNDSRKFGILMNDYGRRQFEKEAGKFIEIVAAGCAKYINDAPDVPECKRDLVKRMDIEYGISPKIAVSMLDLLGLLLRGDTTTCGGQPANEPVKEPVKEPAKESVKAVSLPNTAVNTDTPVKTNVIAASSFTDPRDGQVYRTVKIGNQIWMAENLNYVKGGYCYDNNPDNAKIYGRLYDWDTAKKVCPPGWHLPSREEWETLINFAGGENVAGKNLKAKSGWKGDAMNDKSGNGTDDYGFSAMPGGDRYKSEFRYAGYGGRWWTATENDSKTAYPIMMDHNTTRGGVVVYVFKKNACSVRCVRDAKPER